MRIEDDDDDDDNGYIHTKIKNTLPDRQQQKSSFETAQLSEHRPSEGRHQEDALYQQG